MQNNQIDEVWLSSSESILLEETDVYDLPLFKKIQEFPRFKAVKVVNPTLPNWQESCLHAIKHYNIAAFKVYPNYHGYPSNHVELQRLASFAAAHQLPLLISVRVNDERNQPANLRIPPTNIAALAQWAKKFPETRIVLQCVYMNELGHLTAAPNLYADISFLDHADVVQTAIRMQPLASERLVFGSHACFFYPESSTLKLKFSQAETDIIQQIASGNLAAPLIASV